MSRQSSALGRRFLLISGGAIGAVVLTACTERAPSFVFDPMPAAPPPVKMQRLLVWLPPDDKWAEWSFIGSQITAALAPYGVTVETARANPLEISRSDSQKALIEKFNPTYRLEIDTTGESSSGVGSTTTSVQINLVGTLYRGDSRTPLARFRHRARSRTVPELVPEIVGMFKKGGYL